MKKIKYSNNNMFDDLLSNYSEIFDINNIQDVFVISDTHFNHIDRVTGEDRIARYCGRPIDWKEQVINNWNRLATKDDIVLHLGDFAFGSKEEVYNIRKQLNGKIYLLKGNHDRHSVGWFNDVGITLIKKPFVVKSEHFPILFSHAVKPCLSKVLGINGHQHEKIPFITNKFGNYHINISVEQIHYTPIRFRDLYESLLLLHYIV